jgi:hypothetical protein
MRKYVSFYNLSNASVPSCWKCQSSLRPLLILGNVLAQPKQTFNKAVQLPPICHNQNFTQIMYVVFGIIFYLHLLGYPLTNYVVTIYKTVLTSPQDKDKRVGDMGLWHRQGTSIWQCWSCHIFVHCCQLYLHSSLALRQPVIRSD